MKFGWEQHDFAETRFQYPKVILGKESTLWFFQNFCSFHREYSITWQGHQPQRKHVTSPFVISKDRRTRG